MPDIREISVTLVCGRFTRRVTPEALAREIGVPTVRPALLALLLRPGEPDASPAGLPITPGEPTEGERSFVPIVPNVPIVNVQEYIFSGNVPERSETNVPTHAILDAPAAINAPHRLAKRLAEELGDPGSLPWFERVAECLDERTVLDALDRALRVPGHAVRRSRAAYFTKIVAPLVRQAPAASVR